MNILFILPQIQKGGGQAIQALNLAEQLVKKQNKIIILTFKTREISADIRNLLKKFQIYCYSVHLNYLTLLIAPFLVKKIEKLVQDWQIDVIQSFDPHLSNMIAVLLGKRIGIPVICRIGARHRAFYENKLLEGNFIKKIFYYTKIPSIILKILEYYTITKVKMVIGNTFYLVKALKQSGLLKFHHFNWKVIPNGINSEKFFPGKAIPIPLSKQFAGKKNLLFLGRIEEFKGLDTLLQAVALVKQEIPEIHLIIIGSYQFNYPYYMHLQQLVKKLHLTKEIRFLGEIRHEEVLNYLLVTKMLIFPSHEKSRPFFEGCPSVILEAMATQILVIASNIGGIPEILQHGSNGLIFQPGNYWHLASLILAVLKDPAKFEHISKKARETILKQYTFEIITEKYLRVYNWSLKSGV